jgi:hypothetical protein
MRDYQPIFKMYRESKNSQGGTAAYLAPPIVPPISMKEIKYVGRGS